MEEAHPLKAFGTLVLLPTASIAIVVADIAMAWLKTESG